jgi:hypothetical protein
VWVARLWSTIFDPLSSVIYKVYDVAELEGLRYYDLRHSAVAKLVENGVPYATVARIMGWSASTSVRMTKRHGHIRFDPQRQTLEAIATGLAGGITLDLQGGSYKNPNQLPSAPNQGSELTK